MWVSMNESYRNRKTRLKDKREKGVKLHPLKNIFSDLGE